MLAQQAAEKALKAALVMLDIDPPRSHNLQLLVDMLPADWSVRAVRADLAKLSLWLVESRYPGEWPEPTEADSESAAADARSVVEAVADDIGRTRSGR